MPLSSSSLFPDVIGVLDRVEASVAQDDQRRAVLIQAVTRTCEAQHIPANSQMIATAVDQHLTAGTAPTSHQASGRAAFGWARPESLESLTRKRQGWRARFRRHGRHMQEVFKPFENDGPKFGWSVLYGLSVNVCLGPLSWFLFHSSRGTVFVSLMGTIAWPAILGLSGAISVFGRWVNDPEGQDRLDEARPRDSELRHWASIPETRAYARKCFTSGVPYLLIGDEYQLKAICSAVEQKREEERRVQQRLAMQAIFFVSDEKGSQTAS